MRETIPRIDTGGTALRILSLEGGGWRFFPRIFTLGGEFVLGILSPPEEIPGGGPVL